MLSKALAAVFLFLLLGKLFFRPQLKQLGRWLDRLVNATLVAIVIVWALQLALLYSSQR